MKAKQNNNYYTKEVLEKLSKQVSRMKKQNFIISPNSDYIINGRVFSGTPTAQRIIKTDKQGQEYVRFNKTKYLVTPNMIECEGKLHQNGYNAEGME